MNLLGHVGSSLMLAVPSVILGFLLVDPILNHHLLGEAIKVLPVHLTT